MCIFPYRDLYSKCISINKTARWTFYYQSSKSYPLSQSSKVYINYLMIIIQMILL